MRNKSVVAIVKIHDGNIAESVSKMFSLLGGIDSVVMTQDTVLLKPNWVTDMDYTTGAVTHPGLIKECVKQLLTTEAGKIIIADSSMVGKDTNGAIAKSQLRSELESKKVEIKDFKKAEYINVVVPNALRYRKLRIPREVMESNVIINMPVMKTHDKMPVTLGLKNMKGVLLDSDKKRLHAWGLEEGIIDLNKVVLPDLTIIDGIIGMEGDGPMNGIPAGMNALIASFDPLAAEVVAIKAMGLEPEEIPYIQTAFEAGFGKKELEDIEIVGERLEDIKKDFKRTYYTNVNTNEWGIEIHDEKACSACKYILNILFHEISQRETLNRKAEKGKEPMHIFAGPNMAFNFQQHEKSIGIGKCLLKHRSIFDEYVAGCPPKEENLREAYKRLI